MDRRVSHARHTRRHHRPLTRWEKLRKKVPRFLGNGAYLLLVLSAAALAATLVLSVQSTPDSVAATPAGEWIPLASVSPANVIAAARRSTLFNENASSDGQVHDLSRLGAPVLVHALQVSASHAWPDVYVIPILDASGNVVAAAEADLSADHHAIDVSAIVTFGQPRAPGHLVRLDKQQALTAIQNQRHTALRAGATADLVYFPGNADAQTLGQTHWSGGGESPFDPMWRVPGANQQTYFVGEDGAIYSSNQLPIDPAA